MTRDAINGLIHPSGTERARRSVASTPEKAVMSTPTERISVWARADERV